MRTHTVGKIIGIVLLCLVLIPVVYFLLFFACDTYTDTAEYGDLNVATGYYTGYHKLLGQDHAAVTGYRFDGDETHRKIVIPDSYKGIEIRELGAFLGKGFPIPFEAEFTDASPADGLAKETVTRYETSLAGLEENGVRFDELRCDDFVLQLGKNIKSIYTEPYVSVFEMHDGRTIAHCVRFYVVCSEENESFYSQDGILYNKDGTIFDGFIYTVQELQTYNKAF